MRSLSVHADLLGPAAPADDLKEWLRSEYQAACSCVFHGFTITVMYVTVLGCGVARNLFLIMKGSADVWQAFDGTDLACANVNGQLSTYLTQISPFHIGFIFFIAMLTRLGIYVIAEIHDCVGGKTCWHPRRSNLCALAHVQGFVPLNLAAALGVLVAYVHLPDLGLRSDVRVVYAHGSLTSAYDIEPKTTPEASRDFVHSMLAVIWFSYEAMLHTWILESAVRGVRRVARDDTWLASEALPIIEKICKDSGRPPVLFLLLLFGVQYSLLVSPHPFDTFLLIDDMVLNRSLPEFRSSLKDFQARGLPILQSNHYVGVMCSMQLGLMSMGLEATIAVNIGILWLATVRMLLRTESWFYVVRHSPQDVRPSLRRQAYDAFVSSQFQGPGWRYATHLFVKPVFAFLTLPLQTCSTFHETMMILRAL